MTPSEIWETDKHHLGTELQKPFSDVVLSYLKRSQGLLKQL
jgi:hypothetical protein